MDSRLNSIQKNYKVAHSFIEELRSKYHPRKKGAKYLFEGVDPRIVIEFFIKEYEFGFDKTRGIRREEVLEYFAKQLKVGKLNGIDVVLSGPTDQNAGNGCDKESFRDGEIIMNPVRRGNIRNQTDEITFFGAISDPRDFSERHDRATLALYFIDRINSKTSGDKVNETPGKKVFNDDVKVNPVVFAIGFPQYGDAEYWRQSIFNN